jgi:hypothetical protein
MGQAVHTGGIAAHAAPVPGTPVGVWARGSSQAGLSSNQANLFVTGSNGAVYSNWWDPASGTWHPWLAIGGAGVAAPGAPVAVWANSNYQVNLFVTGSNGAIDDNW